MDGREKRYMALKWKLAFVIVPVVGIIAAIVFCLTHLFMRETIIREVMNSQNI